MTWPSAASGSRGELAPRHVDSDTASAHEVGYVHADRSVGRPLRTRDPVRGCGRPRPEARPAEGAPARRGPGATAGPSGVRPLLRPRALHGRGRPSRQLGQRHRPVRRRLCLVRHQRRARPVRRGPVHGLPHGRRARAPERPDHRGGGRCRRRAVDHRHLRQSRPLRGRSVRENRPPRGAGRPHGRRGARPRPGRARVGTDTVGPRTHGPRRRACTGPGRDGPRLSDEPLLGGRWDALDRGGVGSVPEASRGSREPAHRVAVRDRFVPRPRWRAPCQVLPSDGGRRRPPDRGGRSHRGVAPHGPLDPRRAVVIRRGRKGLDAACAHAFGEGRADRARDSAGHPGRHARPRGKHLGFRRRRCVPAPTEPHPDARDTRGRVHRQPVLRPPGALGSGLARGLPARPHPARRRPGDVLLGTDELCHRAASGPLRCPVGRRVRGVPD